MAAAFAAGMLAATQPEAVGVLLAAFAKTYAKTESKREEGRDP